MPVPSVRTTAATRWHGCLCNLIGLLLLVGSAHPAAAGEIGEELQRELRHRGSHAEVGVIVRFTPRLELDKYFVQDRSRRDSRLMLALQRQQATARARLMPLLSEVGAHRIRDLWIINGISLTLSAQAVARLATATDVLRVEADSHVQGGVTQRGPAARDRAASSVHPEGSSSQTGAASTPVVDPVAEARAHWNLDAIRVPQLWRQGVRGEGVVIASMDTGVDLEHPDLRGSYRGGSNSWFDPHGEEPLPYDAVGHGTQAMGVLIGRAGIGIAPQARWIAARLYDHSGRARMSDIHLVFQWLMDPDRDPATDDAPDVVNASWALKARVAGRCVLEFSEDIQALRAAGIAIVFAAGNDGPNPGTSSSPGNNPGVLSVGAVDRQRNMARQTSRGPSACDAGVFPRLLSPGVHVPTTDLSHGGLRSYGEVSGSSMAAPHAAGVMALLAGAYPHASVAQLEQALIEGGERLNASSDMVFLDAAGAMQQLERTMSGQAGQRSGVVGNLEARWISRR